MECPPCGSPHHALRATFAEQEPIPAISLNNSALPAIIATSVPPLPLNSIFSVKKDLVVQREQDTLKGKDIDVMLAITAPKAAFLPNHNLLNVQLVPRQLRLLQQYMIASKIPMEYQEFAMCLHITTTSLMSAFLATSAPRQ